MNPVLKKIWSRSVHCLALLLSMGLNKSLIILSLSFPLSEPDISNNNNHTPM